MKTFVYGDSHSNHKICQCPQDQMWYSRFVKGELVDRTRAGASTQEMFLLANTDAIANTNCRFIFGAGIMYGRVPMYTDALYANEQIGSTHSIKDCLPYIETQKFDPRFSVAMFHHTMVWATFFTQVASIASLLKSQGHQWCMAHLGHPKTEYFNPEHPLIRPAYRHVLAMPNYVSHVWSCREVCFEHGIRPLDFDTYGKEGHHTVPGQEKFGKLIHTMMKQRGVF